MKLLLAHTAWATALQCEDRVLPAEPSGGRATVLGQEILHPRHPKRLLRLLAWSQ
jgi:hypothetical protein